MILSQTQTQARSLPVENLGILSLLQVACNLTPDQKQEGQRELVGSVESKNRQV